MINSTLPAFSGDGDLDDDREEDLSEKERKELTIVKLTPYEPSVTPRSRLVSVLNLIGYECDRSFLDQSQKEVMQNQSRLLSTLHYKFA